MRRRALLAAAAALAGRGREQPLVFAAVSLGEVLREIAAGHERRGGARVAFAFGGSGDLARQIQAGAPAQLFVSADAARVDQLERAGLVSRSERVDLLANRLAVVVPVASTLVPRRAADLAALPRLALADPETVPAGAYAREWLQRAGVWPAVRERLVPTLDVRAALLAVESGAVPAGVVYATDAAIARRARVAFVVPAGEAPRVVYVAALIAGAGEAARAFFAHLRSGQAGAQFRRFGFEVLAGG